MINYLSQTKQKPHHTPKNTPAHFFKTHTNQIFLGIHKNPYHTITAIL